MFTDRNVIEEKQKKKKKKFYIGRRKRVRREIQTAPVEGDFLFCSLLISTFIVTMIF